MVDLDRAAVLPGSNRQTALLAGAVLTLAALTAGYAIHPAGVEALDGGELKVLLLVSVVGFGTGHHLGRVSRGVPNRSVAAATGGFVTLAVAWLIRFGLSIWNLVLVLLTAGIVLAYHSGLVREHWSAKETAELLGERGAPLVLAVVWVVQFLFPVVGLDATADAIDGIAFGILVVVVLVGVYALDRFRRTGYA